MLTHDRPTNLKQQSDHDLTELSWLTQSDIFDRPSSSSRLTHPVPIVSKSSPVYVTDTHRHRSSPPPSLIDSSDSEHDNDSSSLNSSSERVITTTTTDIVSPPHSALCFWILFAIEDSKSRALTLNEICDWIEHHIEQSITNNTNNPIPPSTDEHLLHSARLKSKIRYHMTKQLSFFVKITKNPINGTKLRYPLWTTDGSKRLLLLDTLLTMNTRQLSLTTEYTTDLFERLCSERQRDLIRHTNDENSCPLKNTKRDKTIHHLGSSEETNNNNKKRKKQRSKNDLSATSTNPSVEVVDAAMTLLLLRQPK
jgi:hypothetical protein